MDFWVISVDWRSLSRCAGSVMSPQNVIHTQTIWAASVLNDLFICVIYRPRFWYPDIFISHSFNILWKYQYSIQQHCPSIDIELFGHKYGDVWFCPTVPAFWEYFKISRYKSHIAIYPEIISRFEFLVHIAEPYLCNHLSFVRLSSASAFSPPDTSLHIYDLFRELSVLFRWLRLMRMRLWLFQSTSSALSCWVKGAYLVSGKPQSCIYDLTEEWNAINNYSTGSLQSPWQSGPVALWQAEAHMQRTSLLKRSSPGCLRRNPNPQSNNTRLRGAVNSPKT